MQGRTDGLGASQADIRQLNRGLALASVARHSRITRAALASEIGLSRPAVSRIVADLVAAGLLSESRPEPGSGPGRPTSYLSLRRDEHVFFAVDVRLEGVLIQGRDLSGALITESRHALVPNASPTQAARLVARQILADCAELGRPASGVGLAVGAHLDRHNQMIIDSTYRPWTMVPLPRLIAEQLGPTGPPVVMDDVSSCAALANWQELAGDLGLSDLAHLQIGIGSGAGLVRRRQGLPLVARPPRIAHVPMRAGGPRCACGARGCFDAVAGFPALVERSAGTGLTPIHGPRRIEVYCAELGDLADSGHRVAQASILEMAGWFARAAAMIINIVRPSRFTYAGYPLLLGPRFHDQFVTVLSEHVEDLDAVLTATSLGDRASVTGAYWLAVGHLMADPELTELVKVS